MSATTGDDFDAIGRVIGEELQTHRAAGTPLKAAFHAIARALSARSPAGAITPRRVRAYHHNEVSPEDIRHAEWVAATRLNNDRRNARIAAARALLAEMEGG